MIDLHIPDKYLKFFLRNLKTRHVVLIGGRRSAKSWSLIKFLLLRASGKDPLHIMIVSASFPSTQLAVKDFMQATGLVVEGSALYGMHCKLPNGSIFQFKSYDQPQKSQGDHCDIMVCEEALNIDEQIINVASLGVRKQIYFVMNPTKGGFINKYIQEDKRNLLITTFKDNPYLLPQQLEEFELMREKALSPTATVLDIYNWKVYGCGEFADMAGKVFNLVYTIDDDEYDNIPAGELKAIDFGLVNSKDSTTLVGVKIYDGCLYAKEYFTSSQLANNKDLAFALYNYHIISYDPIVADYGGLGLERIKVLASANYGEWTEPEIRDGFNIVSTKKMRVIDSLNKILNYDKIYVTSSSKTLRAEMDRYELSPDGKEASKHENCISAMRYAVISYPLYIYNE